MKTLKKFNEAKYKQELRKLENELLPMAVEMIDLLEQLEVASSEELANKLNKKTGFTNATISASAYNIETEFRRLQELENALNGKLSLKDLTKSKQFKTSFLNKLKQKYSVFYTDSEIELLKRLKNVADTYNRLSIEERSQLAINRTGMVINPFSYLLR